MQPAILDPGLELIVGLGNPGAQYEKTRHNAGFWLLDLLANQLNTSFRAQSKFHGELAEVLVPGRKLRLLKPTTFMNNSGRSVAAVSRFYNIPIENILIVYDEIDLPVGVVKLKQGGGHGGHNGIRDMAALGSKDFWRLRIGVAHPGNKNQVVDYVLKPPSKEDKILIDQSIEKSLDIMPLMIEGQMEKAMHSLHTKC